MRIAFVAIMITVLSMSIQAKPTIVAHRGVPFYAPENTTPSLQLALDLNPDGVEMDFYLTADKQVMALHDKTTSRTAMGVNHDIKKTESSVLEKVDVGAFKHDCFKGTTIPYMKEMLDMKPRGKVLVIEIKDDPDTVAPVKDLIEASGHPLSDFAIISFNMDTCMEARKLMPELEVYYLKSARDRRTRQIKNFTADVLKEAKAANLTGVDLDFQGVTKELVDECHKMGMKMWVYTVDQEADVRRMARIGVDSITTNLCDRARRWVDDELK